MMETHDSLRHSRSDALPEYRRVPRAPAECVGQTSCLVCSSELCRYDLPPKALRTLARYERVMRLVATGMGIRQVAREEGVSDRSIYRILSGGCGELETVRESKLLQFATAAAKSTVRDARVGMSIDWGNWRAP